MHEKGDLVVGLVFSGVGSENLPGGRMGIDKREIDLGRRLAPQVVFIIRFDLIFNFYPPVVLLFKIEIRRE